MLQPPTFRCRCPLNERHKLTWLILWLYCLRSRHHLLTLTVHRGGIWATYSLFFQRWRCLCGRREFSDRCSSVSNKIARPLALKKSISLRYPLRRWRFATKHELFVRVNPFKNLELHNCRLERFGENCCVKNEDVGGGRGWEVTWNRYE